MPKKARQRTLRNCSLEPKQNCVSNFAEEEAVLRQGDHEGLTVASEILCGGSSAKDDEKIPGSHVGEGDGIRLGRKGGG